MRRRRTTLTGAPRPTRQLARNLLISMAAQQGVDFSGAELADDVRGVWWAEQARQDFEEDNRDLIDQMTVDSAQEGWFTAKSAPAERKRLDRASARDLEQELPMRLL